MSTHLIQTSSMPGFEKPKTAENIAKDKEYKQNTGKGYKGAQETKMGFYGSFDKSYLKSTPLKNKKESSSEEERVSGKTIEEYMNNEHYNAATVNDNFLESINNNKVINNSENIVSDEQIEDDVAKLEKEKTEARDFSYANNNAKMKSTGTEEEHFKKQNIEKQKKENIEKTIEYPLVKTFLENQKVELGNLSLDKGGKIDIYSIEGLKSKEKEKLGLLLDDLGSAGNKEIFGNSIKYVSAFDNIREAYTSENKESIDYDLYHLIGQNYIDMGKEGEKEAMLGVAIDITKNELLLKYKSIPQDSTTFKNAILNVENGTLKEQLDGIRSLYLLGSSVSGFGAAKSGKQKDLIGKKIKGELSKREEYLISKINIKRIEIKKGEGIGKQKLIKEEANLQEELKEVSSGDIFTGGKNDKIAEIQELLKKVA